MLITCHLCGRLYLVDSNELTASSREATCLQCGARLEMSRQELDGPRQAAPPRTPGEPSAIPAEPDDLDQADGGRQHEREGFPWEKRQGFMDLKAYWQTTRGVMLHPGESLVHWGPPRDMESALLFLVMFGSVGEILANYWVRLLPLASGKAAGSLDNLISFGLFMLKAPLLVLITTLSASLLIHFFLFLLRASKEPWQRTFALFAYVSGAMAGLQLIPFLGLVLAPIWGVVASICSLRELHRTTTWRVVVSFFLPFAILLLLFVTLLLFIVGAGLIALGTLGLP
jgi:hypothetical protein